MKVLLISPKADTGLSDMVEPSHGLAYIAACVLEQGHEVHVIDAKSLDLSTTEVVALAHERKTDIVGITAMTPDIIWAGKIADGIKTNGPEIPIIVGGPHVTALPERTLREFPSLDIAVIGEGERAIVELLDVISSSHTLEDIHKVKGLAFRRGEQVVITEPRQPIADLDSLPFPAWHLFPRQTEYTVFATRGCPFRCKFCMRVMGSSVRTRSPENVVAEIEHNIRKYGMRSFRFEDETFGIQRRWTERLLDMMIESKIPDRITSWSAMSRVNIANSKVYRKMKRAGCRTVNFGIESGSQKILESVHKGFKLNNAKRAIKVAKEAGLRVAAFFIMGHPFETRLTLIDTIRFAAKLNPDHVAIGVMVPYPGTAIWDMALEKEGGYDYISHNWDDYRKYHGHPLGLKRISAVELEIWQVCGYFAVYISHARFRDLLHLLRQHRRSILAGVKHRVFPKSAR
ncbi:B12-binding domain-containing radical SAM protein [Candidatus Poribacteria bacterium]